MIIGLCGPAGSGKDTVRSILERKHGFVGLAFADPIHEMLKALLATIDMRTYGNYRSLKERPVPLIGASYREMAQTLGTEWGRKQIGENFWVAIAMHRVRMMKAYGNRRIVISDVRFPNEMRAIREVGGRIWAITRTGVEPVNDHVSEAMARDAVHFADRIISNDGTIEDLERAVSETLNNINN
jgi:hypothetical protein